MAKLTKRTVDALQPLSGPGARDFFVWDDELTGFGVRVRPNGRKLFVVQYRDAAGASRRMLLGEFGAMTPDEARTAAARQRAAVLEARNDPTKPDPARQRATTKSAARAKHAALTFAELADEFLAECDVKLKPSTTDQYRRMIGTSTVKRGKNKGGERVGELRKAFGRFKVADITHAQVARLHSSMKMRPYHANRALACLSALFTFSERHGHRPDGSNPCRRVVKYREEKRKRYLNDAELASIGEALRTAEREGLPIPPGKERRRATERTAKHRTKDTDAGGARRPVRFSPVAVGVLRFLLLTGWREGEVLTLQWSHVDTAGGVAILPDTKTGQSVRTLGAPALEVLEAMRPWRQKGNPYVFPGQKPGAHYTDTARPWYAVRHAAGLDEVRLHDIRHSFASVGAAGGLTLPLIGAMLGHTDSGTTARYSHLTGSSALKRAADATSAAVAAMLAGDAGTTEHQGDGLLLFRRKGA